MRHTPLAEQMRPKDFQSIVGQEHLLGPNGFITRSVEKERAQSLILCGPPGCGKTSIARLYAKAFSLHFHSLSAIFSGIADLKKIVMEAKALPLWHSRTLVFVDEIHRFNKAQQEAFLPFLEDGTLILVGATAENPSFYLSHALLSRLQVLTLNSLAPSSLEQLLIHYEKTQKVLPLSLEARQELLQLAHGDGRYLFNMIETLHGVSEELSKEELIHLVQRRAPLYDRNHDQHYQLISALHKAIRGSDPNASLYWLCRMLQGGEDPLFLIRRLIRVASEDIGLADPQALSLAIAARDTFQMLGSPEGELVIAELVVYLALAPKSNAIYKAFNAAKLVAEQTGHLSPPKHVINPSTALMKAQDFGKGYQYDHDLPTGFSGQNYFPEELGIQEFYVPVERGFEREMQKRMDYFHRLKTRFQND